MNIEPGRYMAALDPSIQIWKELVICSRVAESVYVAVGPDLNMDEIDLDEDFTEIAIGDSAHKRPILLLADADLPYYSFDDGVNGGALSARVMVDLLDRGAAMAASLRRARAAAAVGHDPYSYHGPDDPPEYDGQETGPDRRDGYLRGGARKLSTKTDVTPTWVLRGPLDPQFPIGSIWDPSSHMRRLGKRAID